MANFSKTDNFVSHLFVMEFPQERINVLYNYEFGWIVHRVICKGQKGQISFFYLRHFFFKNFDNLFSSLACSFPMKLLMNCESLFNWITRKVIIEFRKVRKRSNVVTFWQFAQKRFDMFFFHTASWGWYWSTVNIWISKVSCDPISQNYLYYSEVLCGCPFVLQHVACWGGYPNTQWYCIQTLMSHFKGHFKVRKVQCVDLYWTIVVLVGVLQTKPEVQYKMFSDNSLNNRQ